jgi:hypothetical protein
MSISIPYRPPTPPTPLRERVNLRIIVFIAIFTFLIGAPLAVYLRAVITGGVEKRGDYYEVDLKAMSTFMFDQENGRTEDVPPQWRALDGQVIAMKGEVAPGSLTAAGVDEKFDLVYSVATCCFTGEPQIQHFVKVTLPPTAKRTGGSSKAFEVKGKLRVEVTRDPATQKINGVYHIVADSVQAL